MSCVQILRIRIRIPARTPRRTLSLSSLLPRTPLFRTVKPTPPPSVVAGIARIEADADASPRDAQKQLALFRALVRTDVKAGYDVVVARWERTCDAEPSSPLLRSDEAFQLYLTALVKSGNDASVNAAVQTRESILALPPSPPPPPEPAAASSSSSPAPPADTPPPSRSAEIAHAVLSGHTAQPPFTFSAASPAPPPYTADVAKLAAALGSGAGGSGNPIHVTVNEPKGSWVPGLVKFGILTGVGVFFTTVVFAVLLEQSGLLKAGPQQTEFEPSSQKTVKFSDVHGVDEAKGELQDIVAFLKDPSSFSTLGGRLPKGVLLTGPPGTGKTMLARAVAGEAGVPFLFASGSEFDEMFVGVGAKRVRELFAAARKKQPAIIFIDELDAIGGRRTSRDQHYMKQTLNQLLVEMDGFQQSEGVVVIAATNFPESLDQALVRPGRFDRHIAVPLPDIRGRVQILKHHMKDVTASTEVDVTILARGTPGFSGADLQNMVNQAAIQASKERARAVTLKHFEWAKDRIVMGAERKSQFLDDKVKRMTAYHEGGHALVALYTDGAMPLHKVTCVPRGHALGVTSQIPENDRVSTSLKEYMAEIDVSLGGRVAEELVYGADNVTSGASSDIRAATRTATRMVKYWGFSGKVGPVFHDRDMSAHKKEEIEDEIRRLIVGGQERVTALLRSKEDELHRLAAALVEHETLNSDEVRRVIRGERIRPIGEVLKEAEAGAGAGVVAPLQPGAGAGVVGGAEAGAGAAPRTAM